MKSLYRLTIWTAIVVSVASVPDATAATVKIVPTDLKGAIVEGAEVRIIRAVNERTQAVRSGAQISTQSDGTIDIVIDDPQVRAITIEVSAAGSLAANLQTLLVVDQNISVALPEKRTDECHPRCCYPQCHHRWRHHRCRW
jgi:hypothetical protein